MFKQVLTLIDKFSSPIVSVIGEHGEFRLTAIECHRCNKTLLKRCVFSPDKSWVSQADLCF